MTEIDWSSDHSQSGGLGNSVLYQMVRDHKHHNDWRINKDKVLVIGRVYSAEITRRAGSHNIESGTPKDLYEYIGRRLCEVGVELDRMIEECNRSGRVSFENLEMMLQSHDYLNRSVVKWINEWRMKPSSNREEEDAIDSADGEEGDSGVYNRISFCSKYLHFHAPLSFFIFDSVSKKSLAHSNVGHRRTNWPSTIRRELRTAYGAHCLRILKYIENNDYDDSWNPRKIDSHLMGFVEKK